ncbi:MAG: hypothetical protein ACR652_23215 [Methylocystis sp.]|uniref:hypothetical protein n=1 Tax=Methylocystis sp. TaxID=1911079 RepID=UPI003DA65643
MNFDARHLPPMLGGHLALVQGSAVIGENPARAIALFDLARLLMPGSLVEEAALRREIAILDPVRDVSKLALLSARYVSKYAASPYARNFWDVLRRATIGDPDFLPRAPRFEPIFAKGPAAERVGFGLAVARMAILAGKFDEAQRLVDNASKTATHPLTLKRITAYRNIIAALIQEKSQQNPSPPDVSELDKQDHALVEIASSVKSGLEKREAGTADTQQDGDYQIAASVRQALAKSDELLKRAEPQ